MTSLLDVKVLIALAWPHQVHHAAASSWFAESRTAGWATCPAAEAGFVRGCCNPAVTKTVLSIRDALQMLASRGCKGMAGDGLRHVRVVVAPFARWSSDARMRRCGLL